MIVHREANFTYANFYVEILKFRERISRVSEIIELQKCADPISKQFHSTRAESVKI